MDWWWNFLAAMDDHEGQAAWFQAVGSVVAILIAVEVDRGSARRAAAAREELDTRMRRDRIAAIQLCVARLNEVADILLKVKLVQGQELALADGTVRRLAVAQKAIGFYVANAGEVGPDVVGAMAHAQTVMADALRR